MKHTTHLFLLLLLSAVFGRAQAQTENAAPADQPRLRGEGKAQVTLALDHDQSLAARQNLQVTPGGASLRAGQTKGVLTSQPIRISLTDPLPFVSVVPIWHGQNLFHTNVTLEVRTSTNGRKWSDWQKTSFEGHADDVATRRVGKMLQFEPTIGYVQYRATMSSLTGSAPTLTRLEVVFFSPGETPAIAPDAESQANRASAACTKPSVVSRASWRARAPVGSRNYSKVTHLVVHHEEGSNTASDWAARVRAIEAFHIDGNGWADIGYNYLIDPNGVIYEGRSGGDNVVGAHFCGGNTNTIGVCMLGSYTSIRPTAAALESLKKLLGWKASLEGINVTGTSNHYQAGVIPNVCGHRDNKGCTSCPGDALYAYLPTMRTNIQSYISNSCGSTPQPPQPPQPPVTDTTPPTTSITGPSSAMANFTVTFADADNRAVAARFYQPLEWRNGEWRANRGNGFYNDNFGAATLHPDYALGLADWQGSWAPAQGRLRQSNTTATNTALSTFLSQQAGNTYLYTFAAKVNNTTGNRRFGLHIMASDVSVRERGNSYLIWFALDQQKVSLIETIDNVLTPRASADVSILGGTFSDYKVVYNTTTGVLSAYLNNRLVVSWTDPTPLTTGAHISLRTSEADVEFDDLKVLKSRGTTALITVGAANSNDVRTSASPGAKIKSLVKDAADNWSEFGNLDVNIALEPTSNPSLTGQDPAAFRAQVFPNPVPDAATHVAYFLDLPQQVTMTVTDLWGKPLVKLRNGVQAAGHHEVSLGTQELKPGVYLLRIEGADGRVELMRILKQ
ncbi:N-acetylmuramoyl-L-alanine amidase [Hymenobacter sp. BT664]|uniref:N-acetylmuramoyl-L-alanine amidase n=1 Tax=Hymenobacter montanus TaxID=2771359 RepID=A0A927BI49_9BACT|nr:N-acetylmuramoyl-L-alanine amidase [Hymenobacter montanus]MBD2770417.1 N-acetylmuramoyl-L-alanine amidase [Hymenobacter montanus]